ncbi:PP2C family serine/threonine-protein phosphatase [Gemmatimonas sp.]|uniref:PP2C family serine/threonine-protein phosphatase n=1 Tax=Gemmatimonas sp. TaxID=1962908 RepID=UPI0037BE2E63
MPTGPITSPDATAAAATTGVSGTPDTSDTASAPTTPPAGAEPPPRPIWNALAPTAPWCPDEWREHLEAVAPGLFATGSAAAVHEATGTHTRAEGWSLLLGSRRGRLHAHRGDHREDAGHLVHFSRGWCAAVADGAGSATYSRLGAAIATVTLTHALRDAVQHGHAARDALGPAMRHAAQMANDRLQEFAARVGIALRDLRTTLLVAAWHDGMLAVMQVGDGAMAVVHTDGALSHPFTAATGDFSGEVTHFLPDDGALDVLQSSLRVQTGDHVSGVLLASDGVEDPWYPFTRHAHVLVTTLRDGIAGETPLPTALIPVFTGSVLRAADPLHALTEWLAFEKRGENDDRTLCLATASGFATSVSNG